MTARRPALLALGWLVLLGAEARPQGAVAFQPGIGMAPDGVGLGVTPVVSHDRRYVRLGIGATFQSVAGFQTFPVPAAVAGGGPIAGGVGLPAVGGFGVGFGGGGGGMGMPAGGHPAAPGVVGYGFAGMDGPVAGPAHDFGYPPGPSTVPAGGRSMTDGFAAARAAAPIPTASAPPRAQPRRPIAATRRNLRRRPVRPPAAAPAPASDVEKR